MGTAEAHDASQQVREVLRTLPEGESQSAAEVSEAVGHET
jgi:hypothetical protein